MKIIFIGRGSGLNLKENNTNILILDGINHILLDCGITCPQAFYRLGIKPETISNIAISHLHSDHVGGLEIFAWINYINGGKLNVFSQVDVEQYLTPSMGHYIHKAINFFKDSDNIKFIETNHVDNMKSYGYIIKNILFTMDTKDVMTGDYDFIFHDCAYKKSETHACLEDLRTLPEKTRKKIWLMHLHDADYGDVSDFGGLVTEGLWKP